MKSIHERLDSLEKIMTEPSFLANKGLGNEVGFYVFDYHPSDELLVRERVKSLVDKHQNGDFTLDSFDLYDIILDLLEEEDFRELCEEFEEQKGFHEITSAVNEMLRMEDDNENNLLLSTIKENMREKSVVLLTGVGKCFPLLRSHKVLNNLHQFITENPVVMFFPGEYTGTSLELFHQIKDDNYYRAFRIVD